MTYGKLHAPELGRNPSEMHEKVAMSDLTTSEEVEYRPKRRTLLSRIRRAFGVRGERRDEEEGLSQVPSGGEPEHRVILINSMQKHKFPNNRISTAKYNFLSFVPKFLFEQFRRYANIFFLFVAAMQQIPGVSPTGRFTTLVPLVFIMAVSAIKEIVEDFKRHVEDRAVNRSQVLTLRKVGDSHMEWVSVIWSEVQVGDFLKITSGQFFPADMIQISSSELERMCYIETANLDGETNLKVRQAPKELPTFMTPADLEKLSGVVECELPNRHLYEFSGNIQLRGEKAVPVDNNSILLRGAVLKNTDWVFGLVVYSGHESKLMMNSTAAPLKRSTVDKITNSQIIMMFFLLLTISLISAIANEIWSRGAEFHWYLALDQLTPLQKNFGFTFLTFIILYNNLIPISLQVTLEVVRYVQASFINQDVEMYHEETDTPAKARTSNLNEELGQVKYIFSDKTGTLTCNIMEFKRCSVGGRTFGHIVNGLNAEEVQTVMKANNGLSRQMRDFFTLMAVCHTVVPEHADGEIRYQAASPDEGALVKGAARVGFEFTHRRPTEVTIKVLGKEEKYEILNVLEFTSARKRMSLIVRAPNGKIMLMCKGADTMIYERLCQHGNDTQLTEKTLEHLEEFATDGLRTLCLAAAEIKPDFYDQWRITYDKASVAVKNREEKVADAADLIETNLVLYGASAIEDRLQDGVPDTIADLLKAYIKVWVLTGDKQETAINIGYSTKLLNQDMTLLVINEASLDSTRDCVQRHLQQLSAILHRENNIGLIIDGKTLKHALSPDVRRDFIDIALSVKCVICCRVSPIQKADIVNMVRQNTPAVTLAIGDGANDVAMIQAAHVGIGISGMEGLQAACASDYSIAQFRFLRRLLFVHGAWNHQRLCKLILYSFHKNICLYVIEMWFAVFSGWSGTTLFERWTIGMYNVMFTAAPPLAIGLFDRTCSAETMMKFPELYKSGQNAEGFNKKVFWMWIIDSVYHSICLYFLTMMMIHQDVAWPNGRDGGYLMFGNMVYTYVVVTVCLKAGLEVNSWTWPMHAAIWGSVILWLIFLCAYCNVWPYLPIAPDMSGMHVMLLGSPVFWAGLFLIPVMTLLVDFVFVVVRRTCYKTVAMEVRESEILNGDPSNVILKNSKTRLRLNETARLLKNVFIKPSSTSTGTEAGTSIEVELKHGYAFSQEEHGVVPQSELIRKYDSTRQKPKGV